MPLNTIVWTPAPVIQCTFNVCALAVFEIQYHDSNSDINCRINYMKVSKTLEFAFVTVLCLLLMIQGMAI